MDDSQQKNASNLNRRNFLKLSAGALSLGLSSCASIDGIFTGDKILYDQDVVIVGGGISGLLCAHYLQQRNVSFVILEGSSRLGGRILSIRGPDDLHTELGPWYIRNQQKNLIALFNSLQIGLKKSSLLLKHNNEIISGQSWTEQFKKWDRKLTEVRAQVFAHSPGILNYQNVQDYKNIVELDNTSAEQWIKTSLKSYPSKFQNLIADILKSQFQQDLNQVSALQVLINCDFNHFKGLCENGEVLVPKEGMSQIIDILGSRLAGSIGRYRIKTNTSLAQIVERKNWFECQLRVDGQSKWVLAKRMILTPPPSALMQIQGILNLNLSEPKKKFLQQIHTVGVKSSARMSNSKSERTDSKTILTLGSSGIEWNNPHEQRAITESSDINSGRADIWEYGIDWLSRSGVLGGKINYRPGEYTKYLGAQSESAYDNRLCFAGDSTTSAQFNDLEGAVVSARTATERILMTL